MKYLSLIPVLLITSCASGPKPLVLVKPLPRPVERTESVRHAEMVRAYYVGRYVDPNYPEVMHEHHPVYRVEAYGRWNLKPGEVTSLGRVDPPADAAYSPRLVNDLILAELNHQKEATERVMREARQLARSYDELQKVINEMTAVAKNHLSVSARIASAEQRIAEFEKELLWRDPQPTMRTNEVSPFSFEVQDSPKP